MLDNELEHLGISLKEAEKLLIPRYNMNSLDEVLAAIGGGDIRLNQMVNYLQGKFNKPSAEEQDREALRQLVQQKAPPPARNKDNGRVVVEGVGNLMHHIARCCQPIPGDDIVGFITQGAVFRSTGRTAISWSICNRTRRSASSTRYGVKATPAVIRWWCA